MKKILFLIALFTLMGGANYVKAAEFDKKEVAVSGNTFTKETYTKFSASAAPQLAFDINSFDKSDWEKFVIELAAPTTYADWLLCNKPTPYYSGGWFDVIHPGTTGSVELNLTDGSRDFSRLCLQAGDPSGYREIIVKDIYVSKESGVTKSSILSSISGGTEVVVEKATESGVKAFDMTSVDVSGYDKLVLVFTSPTDGLWILNIDGNNQTISVGTQYYMVDVSDKATLSNLTLSVGGEDFPRVNNFSKLYLVNSVAISSTSDWKDFADAVNGGEPFWDAYLTADIEVTDGTMIGDGSSGRDAANPKAYCGTFDGQNHTITYSSFSKTTEQVTAPFRFVKNGTIQNLKTAGSMSSERNIMGGIAGYVQGTVVINNCYSSINLSTDDTGNDATIGGILGLQDQSPTTLTVTNCMYTGTITGDHAISGIAGYMRNGGGATFTNILYAGSYVTENANPSNMDNIVRGGGTLTNCYYINKIGESTNGTQATDAQLRNGELAYTLQGNQVTQYWGQSYLNSSRSDEYPILTSDASKKVYKENNNNYFANAEGLLPDPVQNGKLSWKHSGNPSAPYVYKLSTEKATSGFELVTTSDAYYLNVTSAGATTLVLPCNIAKLPSGVKAYDLTFDGSSITPTEVNSITANKPVLINASEGQYIFSTSLPWSDTFDFPSITETTNGALTGVYNTSLPFSYVPAGSYVLQNGEDGLGFYQVANENEIKITSFRAYLNAGGLARGFIGLDEMVTGINEVKVNKAAAKTGKIYNLNGQIVSKPSKGLYIVDGKVVSF